MDGSGGSKKPSPFTHIPLDKPKDRLYRRYIVRHSSASSTPTVLPSTHDLIQLQRELQLFNVRAQGRAAQLELGDECLRTRKTKEAKTPPPQGHVNSTHVASSASHKKEREKSSLPLKQQSSSHSHTHSQSHSQSQPQTQTHSLSLEKKQKLGGGSKTSAQDTTTVLRKTPEKIVVKLKKESSLLAKDIWSKAIPSEDDDFIPSVPPRKQKSRTPIPNSDASVAKRKRKADDSGDDFSGFSENEKAIGNSSLLGSAPTSYPSQKSQTQKLGKSGTNGQSSSHLKKRKIDPTIPSTPAAPPFTGSEMQIAPSAPAPADGNPLKSAPSAAASDDFSRVKVANQVPIQTFYTSIESYFRPVTEEDLNWLEHKEDDVPPQLIPPLGKNYLDVWSDADQAISAVFSDSSAHSPHDSARRRLLANNHHNLSSSSHGDANVPSNGSRAQSEISNDDHAATSSYMEDGCGPLTARMLCSLLEDAVVPRRGDGAAEKAATDIEMKFEGDEVIEDEKSFYSSLKERQLARAEMMRMERRLKEELQCIGLLDDDDDINWASREDDEVSVSLRKLQRELDEQVKLNQRRKQQLLAIAKNHMGYQEYNNALDELDKQVESAYVKRFRPVKGTNKKKKALMTPTYRAIIDQAVGSIDRRQRFINGVGCIFPAERFKVPKGSIFRDGARLW